MPIKSSPTSLSREFSVQKSVQTIGLLTSGMSIAVVQTAAQAAGIESSLSGLRAMLTFDASDILLDDELLRTCQAGSTREAKLLWWIARLWADQRLAEITETVLTDKRGKYDAAKFNAAQLVPSYISFGIIASPEKSASNFLRQMADCGFYKPIESGKTILGIAAPLPTSSVVPHVVRFVEERAPERLGFTFAPGADPVDLAIALSINKWLNLTPQEFRNAAHPAPPLTTPPGRAAVPIALRLLDEELHRRGQVVLQGAPGVGKTYVAMQYVDWASVSRRTDSHVATILEKLPSHERTPERVAEVAVDEGLTCVWDIAQFHPSYGYEDFVRTLVPRPVANGVTFQAEHRRLSFVAAVGVALRKLGSFCDVVLIVDEINRADISRVFGELLYALEYRGEQVSTPYEVDGTSALVVPDNVLLLGTMNTADRSIALIDYALRRRFTFIDLAPDRAVVETAGWFDSAAKTAALNLYDLVADLFVGRGPEIGALAIGHSYFMPSGTPASADEALQAIARRFAYEVAPLLAEYAAEGLIPRDDVETMLKDVGILEESSRQNEIETQVLAWMTPTV